MTIQITKPAIEDLLERRLQSGKFKDAEDVILEALKAIEPPSAGAAADRAVAIERLRVFGKSQRTFAWGLTIRELRDEARP